MAGRGPAPKAEGERIRRNREPEMAVVVSTGEKAGRPLPEGVLPDGESWHPQTLAWWEALREFPLLKDEPEIGWQFLIDTALMHHTMWTKGRWEFAAEIRLRVAKFGSTPEDRLRLKITVAKPGESTGKAGDLPANVSAIEDRRKRLASG